MNDPSIALCGKKEKYLNCVVNNAGVSVYPVYYSDEGYDVTEYAKSLATIFMAQFLLKNNQLPAEVLNAIIPPIKNSFDKIEMS